MGGRITITVAIRAFSAFQGLGSGSML